MARIGTTAAAVGAMAIIAGGGMLAARTMDTTGVQGVDAIVTRASEASLRTYAVDNVHSNVVFKIRHAGVAPFFGRFNELAGDAVLDDSTGTLSSVSVTVKTDSVDSKNERRDNHLKSPDFFNTRQYPEIAFQSTEVGDGTLAGELTFHGKTAPITATLSEVRTGQFGGKDAIGFEATFKIKRSDFGLTKYLADDGSEAGPLGNTVEIIVAIEAHAE